MQKLKRKKDLIQWVPTSQKP